MKIVPRRTPFYLLVAAPLLMACLACTFSVGVAQVLAARSQTPQPYFTAMCTWARSGRVGLWWNVANSTGRTFSQASRYNAVCLAIPWAPQLPMRGIPSLEIGP